MVVAEAEAEAEEIEMVRVYRALDEDKDKEGLKRELGVKKSVKRVDGGEEPSLCRRITVGGEIDNNETGDLTVLVAIICCH